METKDIIFELRTKKGLSQEALAEKVFVTRQAVSRWELQKEVKMQRLKQNRAASFIAVALVYIIATVVAWLRIALHALLDFFSFIKINIGKMLAKRNTI